MQRKDISTKVESKNGGVKGPRKKGKTKRLHAFSVFSLLFKAKLLSAQGIRKKVEAEA